jgi:two-component system, chemotaxis family, chemotaxis protein CheY
MMKVLVVDDSGVMRRIHRNTLEENNVAKGDIFEAEDGEVALTIADAEDIGVFLLDWNMPKIDGLEFVKRVRVIDKYKDTPIFMITSEAAKYNVVEAVKAGVTNYIIKPIQGNMLWEKIGKYFT